MSITLGNIIVGSANFFEGNTSSLRDLGATINGVTLSMGTNDFTRIEIDQLRGVALLEQIMKGFMLSTVLSEPTLENLAVAFNQVDGSLASSELSIEDNPRGARRVVFVGPAPGTNKQRSFNSDTAQFVGTPEHTYQRGEGTQLPIELELVPTARTYASSLRVGGTPAADGFAIASIGAGDALTPIDALNGGVVAVVSGTGVDQSRAIVDSTVITSTAGAATGSIGVYPTFTTVPAVADWVTVNADKPAQWGTIKDVG
jgi:hypothetical protein